MTVCATGVRATTLTPFHYHSLAIQAGTSTLAEYIGDVAVSFAMASVLGCLHGGPALPVKRSVKEHLMAMPIQASLFETKNPQLMQPIFRKLNLEHEGIWAKGTFDATATGNLKTFYAAQEVPAGVMYEGALFGLDPFDAISEEAGENIDEIIIRIGRNLGGVVKLERAPDVQDVRLNAHTAILFDMEKNLKQKMIRYALHNIQPLEKMSLDDAKQVITSWRKF